MLSSSQNYFNLLAFEIDVTFQHQGIQVFELWFSKKNICYSGNGVNVNGANLEQVHVKLVLTCENASKCARALVDDQATVIEPFVPSLHDHPKTFANI